MNPLTITPLSIKIFEYLLSSRLEQGIRNLLCTSTFLWRTFHATRNAKWWHLVSTSLPIIHGPLVCPSSSNGPDNKVILWWIKKLFDLQGSMLETIALPLCSSCHQTTIKEIKKRYSFFVSLTCISNFQPQILHTRKSIRRDLPLRGGKVNFTESDFSVQNVPPNSLLKVYEGNYWQRMVTFLRSLQHEDLEDSRFANTASSIRVWLSAWLRASESLDFIFTPLETTLKQEGIEANKKGYLDALRMLFLVLFLDGFDLNVSCHYFPTLSSAKHIKNILNDFGLEGDSQWHTRYLTLLLQMGDIFTWINCWLQITSKYQASSCLFDSKVVCHFCLQEAEKMETDEAYEEVSSKIRRSTGISCVFCFLRLLLSRSSVTMEEIDDILKILVKVCESSATEERLLASWQRLPSFQNRFVLNKSDPYHFIDYVLSGGKDELFLQQSMASRLGLPLHPWQDQKVCTSKLRTFLKGSDSCWSQLMFLHRNGLDINHLFAQEAVNPSCEPEKEKMESEDEDDD